MGGGGINAECEKKGERGCRAREGAGGGGKKGTEAEPKRDEGEEGRRGEGKRSYGVSERPRGDKQGGGRAPLDHH